MVRLRTAVHVDHRGDAPRNEWVEMAGVHVGLPVRPCLYLRRNHILERRRPRPLVSR
ncbi:hypothetical protein NOVOSPHI9U_780040 [Novosphingobium sp. 9U]|nr:hypothetical protein NOVOSPHI9U_780040 [Novosphingobium sp. 9U]